MLTAKLIEMVREFIATSLKTDGVVRTFTIHNSPTEDGRTYIEITLRENDEKTVYLEMTIPKKISD